MDSKAVDRLLKPILWDRLKAHGFAERAGRTTWRRGRDAIEVVNVQSFNAYLAERIGATTFSFSVRVGVAYPFGRSYRSAQLARPHARE